MGCINPPNWMNMGGWFFGFTTSVIYRWMVLRSFPVPRWWHCPCSAGWHWSRNSRGSWVTSGWFRQSWPSNKRENREWMEWAPLFSDKPKRIRMKGFGASKMMIGYLKLLGNQQTAGPRIKYQIRFGIDWWMDSIDGTSLRPKILVIQEPNYGDIW